MPNQICKAKFILKLRPEGGNRFRQASLRPAFGGFEDIPNGSSPICTVSARPAGVWGFFGFFGALKKG
jgi:hypothetical protein